jgi:hypothetical protein
VPVAGGLQRALAILMLSLVLATRVGAGPFYDEDGDGFADTIDLCPLVAIAPSPCSLDADMDGYLNACDGDFDNDGVVNAVDSGSYLVDLAAGTDSGIGSDMSCDGVVNAVDSALYLDQLARGVPGPSTLPCAGTVPCP